MSISPQDMSASGPRSRPAFAGGQTEDSAAGRRARVLLWLRGLAGIGRALAARMSVVALQQSQDPTTARVDLNLAWLLLARAMRWTRALRARLCADANAANVRNGPVARLSDPAAANENIAFKSKTVRQPAPNDGVGRIEGKPTVAVLEQICADLGALGAMLGITDAERRLAEIAAQARAMLLGGEAPADGVQGSGPPVVSGALDERAPVIAPSAVTQLRAPDTG